jgi:hypothetical protein
MRAKVESGIRQSLLRAGTICAVFHLGCNNVMARHVAAENAFIAEISDA